MQQFKRRAGAWAVIFLALALTTPTSAVVLHANDAPAGTPGDVIGRWGGTATVVAIDSQHVITTQHQGGGTNVTVKINGTNYRVAAITNILDPDVASNTLDLRLIRLETFGGQVANLTNHVDIYTGTAEVGATVTIGGYGEGRGADIYGGPPRNPWLTGYQWDGVIGTERWGANTVDFTSNDTQFGPYTNDILVASFQGPQSSSAVPGEASLAAGDSGGGWFINDNGQWKVAGLTEGVENVDEALFGEQMTAVRLSSYAAAIVAAIPFAGDLDLDGDVDNQDLGQAIGNFTGAGGSTTMTRADGDVDGDGDIDNADIGLIAGQFTGAGATPQLPAGFAAIPEPASLALLGVGGLVLARRRTAR